MTPTQIAAILMLLQAFGVDAQTVAKVSAILTPPVTLGARPETPRPEPPRPEPPAPAPVTPTVPPQTPAPVVPPTPVAPPVAVRPDPFYIGRVDFVQRPDSWYMRVTSTKPITQITVDVGILGAGSLNDGESISEVAINQRRWKLHNYEYPITFTETRDATITFTDADGQTLTERVRVPI